MPGAFPVRGQDAFVAGLGLAQPAIGRFAILPLREGLGQRAARTVGQGGGHFHQRCVRRRSPSSAGPNSHCAHWAGGNKVEVVTRSRRRRNRGPATITGHPEKMAHQFLEEKPREDVGNDKGLSRFLE